nr:MAG TPA: hypothetical protein [Caudoviricetes sp.]DAT87253.1 MAG TPA: hypothetical protein [Caudoviricetes sp.]
MYFIIYKLSSIILNFHFFYTLLYNSFVIFFIFLHNFL